MEFDKLNEFVDQQRWLLNNGLVHESSKNQLFFFGSIVHPAVQAVEMDLNPDAKSVAYTLYFTKDLLDKIAKYKTLSTDTSLIGMWKFKRLLKKEGDLNLQGILSTFVKGFAGPAWTTTITLVDFDVYIDTIGERSEPDGQSQQPNKLPD
jgi:hypothetical protein